MYLFHNIYEFTFWETIIAHFRQDSTFTLIPFIILLLSTQWWPQTKLLQRESSIDVTGKPRSTSALDTVESRHLVNVLNRHPPISVLLTLISWILTLSQGKVVGCQSLHLANMPCLWAQREKMIWKQWQGGPTIGSLNERSKAINVD